MGPRLQPQSPGLLGVKPLQWAPTCTSWVEAGQQMWKALAGSWPLTGCCTGPQPLTQPLQTLLVGGLWSPGAPPLATGVPPPTAENWLDVAGAASERKEDQVA